MEQMQRSKEKHRRSGHFGGADTARLVRLLGTNFTNPETALRLEYERSNTDASFEDGDDVGCLPRGNAGDRGDGAQRGSL